MSAETSGNIAIVALMACALILALLAAAWNTRKQKSAGANKAEKMRAAAKKYWDRGSYAVAETLMDLANEQENERNP